MLEPILRMKSIMFPCLVGSPDELEQIESISPLLALPESTAWSRLS